jgi:PKD repeat protein
VIIRTDPLGSNTTVYVNPTSGVLGVQTPYLTASGGSGITPAISLDSFILDENKNGSAATVGAGLGKVCAASDYASVYNFLSPGLPPVASFTGTPTTGAEPLNVSFTDTSTGSITNWFWDFGDSNTTNVTTNVVSHTYAAGTYTVTLIVSGSNGAGTNSQTGYITALTAFQAWQIQYFGSTNGSAAATTDADGDGQNNLAEFLTGTDPTNNASAFRITSIAREGNDLRITWSMGSAHTNALQFAPGTSGSYTTNSFTDIFTVTNTVGTLTNYLDLGAATNFPSRYYRIRLVP